MSAPERSLSLSKGPERVSDHPADDQAAQDEPLDLPLEGVTVLDFSQFLAGPVAALRLADLGARVIKIERPGTGDLGRTLAFGGRMAGASSGDAGAVAGRGLSVAMLTSPCA